MESYKQRITSGEDRALFERLQPEIDAVHAGWRQVLPVSRLGTQNDQAYALYLSTMVDPMGRVDADLQDLVEWNRKGSAAIAVQTGTQIDRMLWWAEVLGLFSLSAGSAISWWMIRSINRDLVGALIELSSGSHEIAAAAGPGFVGEPIGGTELVEAGGHLGGDRLFGRGD